MRARPEGARGGYERAASREGDPQRSTEDGGAAAGGCKRVKKSWKIPVVQTERSEKQEKVSCLVLLEYVVYLGKRREVRLNSKLRLVTDSLRHCAKGKEFYSGNDEKPF